MINYRKIGIYVGLGIVLILSIRGAYEFISGWNKSYVVSQATTNEEIRVIVEAAVADTLLKQIEKPYQESNYQTSGIKGSTKDCIVNFIQKLIQFNS